MYALLEMFADIRDFAELGGEVLVVIAFVLALMWILIFERCVYFRLEHPKLVDRALERWQARREHRSWQARQVRQKLISEVALADNRFLPMIKTLIALCPLLGLLGTVTGMIEVFSVMSVSGMGNVRSMAAGVSKATIPTMAGMVAALSGVFASMLLNRYATRERELLQDHLTTADSG
jgi:biopolymer transport protein ExbB